jgi:hypothetical protein
MRHVIRTRHTGGAICNIHRIKVRVLPTTIGLGKQIPLPLLLIQPVMPVGRALFLQRAEA